jgi:hypothetical protein
MRSASSIMFVCAAMCAAAVAPAYGQCDLPAIPLNVFATDATLCNGTRIGWSAAAGATSYRVYRSGSPSLTNPVLLSSNATNPFLDTTGNSGIGYFYYVRASNSCGLSAPSAADLGGREYASQPPRQVTATSSECTGVTVRWVGSVNANTYTIYRNTVNSTTGAAIVGAATNSTFIDTSAAFSTTYYYWVRSGNECGASSYVGGVIGRRLLTLPAPASVTVPQAYCQLPAYLTWSPVAGASSYTILKSEYPEFAPYEFVTAISSAFTSLAVASSPGQATQYSVSARDACGRDGQAALSGYSIRFESGQTPINLQAVPGACGRVQLTWDRLPGTVEVILYRSTLPNYNTSEVIAEVNGSAYLDTVQPGTTYYYWARSANNCGNVSSPTPMATTRSMGVDGFTMQPVDTFAYIGSNVYFAALAPYADSYQWYHRGVALVDGGNISGSLTRYLLISGTTFENQGAYRCVAISECNSVQSQPAELTLGDYICPADYNQDGGIDNADVDAFFADWINAVPASDVNLDGGIDAGDVDYFFAVWSNGGC